MLTSVASCSGQDAWRMLVEISQHGDVKFRDIAVAFVAAATGGLLPPETESARRQALARTRAAQTLTDLFSPGHRGYADVLSLRTPVASCPKNTPMAQVPPRRFAPAATAGRRPGTAQAADSRLARLTHRLSPRVHLSTSVPS